MHDLTIERPVGLDCRPDPGAVRELYESQFADCYDARADRWERAMCGPALAAFDDCLASLPQRPLNVLDVGCGTGRNLRRLAKAGVDIDRYVGVDSSARMLKQAVDNHPYSRARFVAGEALESIDAADSPDVILLTWVLSHHADPVTLVDAAARALAPGGRLLVLALTETNELLGRALSWRFRSFLQSNPVDQSVMHQSFPNFLATSCFGLITVAEIPPRPACGISPAHAAERRL